MAHITASAGRVQREMVDASGVIMRDFQLVAHLVTRNLSPDVWLTPADPSATHLERVALNIA